MLCPLFLFSVALSIKSRALFLDIGGVNRECYYRCDDKTCAYMNPELGRVGNLELFPKVVDPELNFGGEAVIAGGILAELSIVGGVHLFGSFVVEKIVCFLEVFLLHIGTVILAIANERVRGGIADILGVCNRRILTEHKVDIFLCYIGVLGILRNAHRVDEVVYALLGIVELEVGIGSIAYHRRNRWNLPHSRRSFC